MEGFEKRIKEARAAERALGNNAGSETEGVFPISTLL